MEWLGVFWMSCEEITININSMIFLIQGNLDVKKTKAMDWMLKVRIKVAHFENKGAGGRSGSGLHRPEHSLELLLRNILSYNSTVLGQSLNTIPTLLSLLPLLLLTRSASSVFTDHDLPGTDDHARLTSFYSFGVFWFCQKFLPEHLWLCEWF